MFGELMEGLGANCRNIGRPQLGIKNKVYISLHVRMGSQELSCERAIELNRRRCDDVAYIASLGGKG